MIGHYLLTLSEEQEDRVLTRQIIPLSMQCLMGAVADWKPQGIATVTYGGPGRIYWMSGHSVGHQYDWLCSRFGAPRVNAAIRNRILSNRARRILQNAPVSRDTEVVESVR